MPNIWQVMDRLKAIKARKEKEKAGNRRIEDLFVKFYEYNPEIRLPIPNLFANSQIQKQFGGMDKINFENDEHIARLLFILRNQENDVLVNTSPEDQEKAIRKIMMEIPASQKEHYQRALFELFTALKKNSIRRQKEIMQEVLQILQN